jgi:CheY-like chemotaxis protein
VRVESPGEEKGATFTIELPISGPQATKPGNQRERHVLEGIRVLVVDDDQDMRDTLQFVLEYYGAEVTVAASVAEALAALERSKPDVLLSGLAMPGESGYDLMRKIAARQDAAGALPAAALTSYSREDERERALAAGFRIHLGKPIEPDALVAAVAQLAGGRSRKVSSSDRRARPPNALTPAGPAPRPHRTRRGPVVSPWRTAFAGSARAREK